MFKNGERVFIFMNGEQKQAIISEYVQGNQSYVVNLLDGSKLIINENNIERIN